MSDITDPIADVAADVTADDFVDPDPAELQPMNRNPSRGPNTVTRRDRILAREKQRKAVELRKAGLTYQAIADACGYNSPQAAHAAVDRALKEMVQEPVQELRVLQIERLNHMIAVLWSKVNAGDERAIDTALRVQDKIDRLMGTDAAQKVTVTNTDAIVIVEGDKDSFIQAMQRMSGADEEQRQLANPEHVDSTHTPERNVADAIVDANDDAEADDMGYTDAELVDDVIEDWNGNDPDSFVVHVKDEPPHPDDWDWDFTPDDEAEDDE